MATNNQRRETERQRLQRELVERRAREASRKRNGIIASVVGALVLVAAVVVIVVVATGDSGGKKDTGSKKPATTPATPTEPATQATACGQKQFPTKKYPAASGASVSYQGVTVKGATDLGGSPTVTSKASADPAKLQYKDLVVGKGAAANPSACVDVQYVGVQYKSGAAFDKSWSRPQLGGQGQVAEFPLTGVVPGFTQGIGGTTGVAPMRVGGRRIVILPSALAYGSQGNPQAGIAPNTPLVFVIDLVATRAAS